MAWQLWEILSVIRDSTVLELQSEKESPNLECRQTTAVTIQEYSRKVLSQQAHCNNFAFAAEKVTCQGCSFCECLLLEKGTCDCQDVFHCLKDDSFCRWQE